VNMVEGLPVCERDGPVALIRFNRPERLNAFDGDVIECLVEQLEQLAGDVGVRAVILTGSGRGFCAGGDLRTLRRTEGESERPRPASSESNVDRMLSLTRASQLLHEMPKVTIAAVNGPCAGAGFSLACAADLRIAARSAVFVTAFLRAGQTGDYGGTWFLPRLIGSGKARELFFLGDRIDAEEAERIGLVNRVVADDDLIPNARELAGRVAECAPLTVAGIKANLNDADALTLGELLRTEAVRFARNRSTWDSSEAVAAFLEKRPPVFEGR
jgi:2-(1,2-epoxy-1,2-dihydrophenyl)acetyl-CoA isomerase